MTVHAAPSSVFLGEGAKAELFLGKGSFAALRSHTVFSYWLLSCQDGHRCGVSLVINQNKHATSTNRAARTTSSSPLLAYASSTSARHRSVRLDS